MNKCLWSFWSNKLLSKQQCFSCVYYLIPLCSFSATEYSRVVYQSELPIVGREACKGAIDISAPNYPTLVTENTVCAGGQSGVDACSVRIELTFTLYFSFVSTTRHWQTFGGMVQELNVCTVTKNTLY